MSCISRSSPSAKSCSNAAISAASVSPRFWALARRSLALCRALLKDMSVLPVAADGGVGASIVAQGVAATI